MNLNHPGEKPNRIYLDHNATTMLSGEVRNSMTQALDVSHGNPASQHQTGQRARRLIAECREQIAIDLDLRLAPPDEEDQLVFTSSGTESNNTVIFSAAQQPNCQIIYSAIEHPSITKACQRAQQQGAATVECHVDQNGQLDLDHLKSLITDSSSLVTMMAANHETGVVQPINEIGQLCREREVVFHSDVTQWIGKRLFSFQNAPVDAITLTPHKFHGPIGIGGLVFRKTIPMVPMFVGGFQQAGFRAGTESILLSNGFATALTHALTSITHRQNTMREMRDRFESRLTNELNDVVIHGKNVDRLEHVSCVAFPGCDAQQLFLALDVAGVDCSTGSACASGSSENSPVLIAMGLSERLISSSLRFSFGLQNGPQDADLAAERIIRCVKHLHRS